MSSNILTIGASADRAGEVVNQGNKSYICAYTAITSLAKGIPVMIQGSAVNNGGKTPVAVACATTAIPTSLIGVCTSTIAAAGWYWFQIRGLCNAYLLSSTACLPGGMLQVSNGGTNFNASVTTFVELTSTSAICQVTFTSGATALKSVFLLGHGSQIA